TRRPGSDEAVEGTPGQSYVHGTAAADVGDAERTNASPTGDWWERTAVSWHNTTAREDIGQSRVPHYRPRSIARLDLFANVCMVVADLRAKVSTQVWDYSMSPREAGY